MNLNNQFLLKTNMFNTLKCKKFLIFNLSFWQRKIALFMQLISPNFLLTKGNTKLIYFFEQSFL